VHISIREDRKPKDGKKIKEFFIGDEKFNDLNEILAHYMDPRTSSANLLFEFRNFLRGSSAEVDVALREKKRLQPNTIPYLLSISYDHPGRFVLSYLPHTSIKREFVMLSDKGIRFRKLNFNTPDNLVAWFKKHYKEAPPPPTPRRETTPAIPMDTGGYPGNFENSGNDVFEQQQWDNPRGSSWSSSSSHPSYQQQSQPTRGRDNRDFRPRDRGSRGDRDSRAPRQQEEWTQANAWDTSATQQNTDSSKESDAWNTGSSSWDTGSSSWDTSNTQSGGG